jgi:aspartyl-tRNA(Asn)/glutamyl-tRNA(Gln) amidotransferase subunit A
MLRARTLSSVELTEACLERIRERDGGGSCGGPNGFDGSADAINAWVRVYPERARRAARGADRRLAREGERAPLLCGIPIGLKDLYGVAGLPLTASSRVLEGNVAGRDAVVWERLREQGMVLLGHTHTHEFAAGGTTDQVGNPWDLGRVAGGSSGGSAAAVVARMTPVALGSDTCGSLRIPSACCGTSTIKPTHGRLPIDGVIPLAPSLDHPGPIARTIADCAAVLIGMALGGPAIDPTATPAGPLGALPLEPRIGPAPLAGVRIAITDRPDREQLAPACAAALETARRACERLGAEVVFEPAPWWFDWDDLTLVLLTEAGAYHAPFADRLDRYRPAIAEFVAAAATFTDAHRYLGAQTRRAAGTAAWEAWFQARGVDLVLEPTLPVVPMQRGPGYDTGHGGGAGDPMIALTSAWDMAGMPVASLPVSWDAGVSLIAPRGREAAAVATALDLQSHELGVPVWSPPAEPHA